MSKLKIYTSQFRYGGDDRLDITVKSGIEAFAPTWDMVKGHKDGTLANEDYIKMYKDLMNKSYKTNKKLWRELLSRKSVTLVCYCAKDCFCHRVVLAEMLVKAFGCEYVGEVDSKGNLIIRNAKESTNCEFCLKDGVEIELFESEHLSRCPKCIKGSFMELTGKEHFELIQKEKEKNEITQNTSKATG
ncbi:hypothetical protein BSK59_16150 [Paenibacillus odorifer]|uniref:DUF488 family protein, N3 subclade n=1 Tax=Paenibacillus odorifer TaxID=189426 RepID=UPI00096EB709|nr:DUF488 family protein [Paenibacillus odorifer]OME54111.1 hypothetical protein BSK59_16150 [Paenibacillus odorifer]